MSDDVECTRNNRIPSSVEEPSVVDGTGDEEKDQLSTRKFRRSEMVQKSKSKNPRTRCRYKSKSLFSSCGDNRSQPPPLSRYTEGQVTYPRTTRNTKDKQKGMTDDFGTTDVHVVVDVYLELVEGVTLFLFGGIIQGIKHSEDHQNEEPKVDSSRQK